jgi:RNA polymerase sigma factor (sigma-70 family)
MRDRDFLAERFEEERPQLRRIAYRMLGTIDEADDAVQEAWIKLSGTDESAVENLGAWLTTVVSRVCLDMLRTRRSRREEFVGSWMPEPIDARGGGADRRRRRPCPLRRPRDAVSRRAACVCPARHVRVAVR